VEDNLTVSMWLRHDRDGKKRHDTVNCYAMIDACGASWNHARKTLRSSLVFDASILLQTDCTLDQAVTANIVAIWRDGVAIEDIFFLGNGKEQCARVSTRPILAVHPEMIAPGETLPACPENIVPVVISQLEGLIHPAMAIAEVSRLWRAEMRAEALDIKTDRVCKVDQATVG